MANEFVARNGVIAQNNSVVSGSLVVTNGITGSLFGTSSQALTASYSITSSVAYSGTGSFTGSFIGVITGSLFGTSSQALSASYAFTASSAINAFSASNALTASFAQTSSFANNFTVANTLTAQTLVVSTISSSVVYSSGSNIFGNSTANTQTMTGSLNVSGSATIIGRVTATDITGSLFGTASQAITASFALTASYVASIAGLSTSQIATGSVTASVGQSSASFQLVSGSTNFLYVSNSGNIGIGTTTNINDRLTVLGNAVIGRSNTASQVYIGLGTPGNVTPSSLFWSFGLLANSNDFNIQSYDGTTLSSRLRIDTSGRVGIGTSTPSASLDVSGSFRYTNTLSGTGSVNISGSTLITGSLNVSGSITTNGTITAQTLVVQTVTSSIVYSSGSNIFGNALTDTQTMTGSVNITGSLTVIGKGTINDLTGSLFGTASQAVSASLASTASVAYSGTGSFTGSFIGVHTGSLFGTSSQAVSASLSQTSSVAYSGTGSFTGSFIGVHTGSLFGTASQALTASYLLGGGGGVAFPYSGSAQITGSLGVTGSLTIFNGSSNSLFVSTSGNVGIGLTNPSALLYVSGSGSGSLMQISSHVSSSIMFVSGSGNVGFGLTQPRGRVHATGSGTGIIGDAADNFFGDYSTGDYIDIGHLGAVGSVFLDTRGTSTNVNLGYRTKGTGNHIWTYDGGVSEAMRINGVGSVGIGTTSLTGYNLRVSKNITGLTNAFNTSIEGTVQSDVTSAAVGLNVSLGTVAAISLNQLRHVSISQGSFGGGSAVTNQYGIYVDQITGATNNYGFFGNIASAANRWNLFMNGSAQNFLSGSLGIGQGKTVPTAQLDISGSALITGSLGVTGPITGSSILSTGTITAQTLVVQTITSSITYSSGSNIFGSQLTDRQTMTGSINMTGSLNLYGNQNITGSLNVSGSLTLASASLNYQHNLSVTAGGYQVITSAATASYRCAFFDYVMFSGSIVRGGTVTSTWSGSSTEYYENYTADLGGSTSGVTLQTALSTGNIQLQASASTAAWTIRSLIRLL